MLPRVHAPVIAAFVLAVPALTWMRSDLLADTESSYTVLAIHWGDEEYPASPVINAAIRQALAFNTNVRIDYFAEYLEYFTFDAGDASESLAEYIRRKYRDRRIDVVMAIADPSLRFVLDHRAELFPNVPIVYSGVAIPESAGRRPAGLTAVMRGTAYIETLELALALHPSTEQVYVIANGVSRENDMTARSMLAAFSHVVRLIYLDEPSLPSLIAAVKTLPPKSLVLYIWHSQNGPGSLLYAHEVAPLVVEASAVPVYGTHERYIGSGVVGGVVRSVHETGFRMGEMARQIIGGTRPADIPIEDARLVTILDWRQLQRWRIDSSEIPPEAEVRFRVPTLWESYRSYVVITFLLIAAQLMLIGGLLGQRARRRRVEDALRANESTLRTSYERTRQLAGRLMSVQEATYANIARDLHDDVCQDLIALSLEICKVKRVSAGVRHFQTQRALSKLEQWPLGLANAVRRLSHELHPATLGLLGLASAIKAHCIEVHKRRGVDVRFADRGDLKDVRPELSVSLFRMAQEAIRNALVHGGARHLAVEVVRSGDRIELTVTDDGAGFDVEAVHRNGTGLGLVSMEERAHALGGSVHVTSHPGQGTTVYVSVPAGTAERKEIAPSMECE